MMSVEHSVKPVVATEEAKPDSVEHPIDRYHEEGEIVGDGDESSKPAVPESHPLEHSWTFWFDNPTVKSKQTTWGSSLRSMFTFSTAEEFWSLYNNMRHPSKLANGADLYCFKHNIEPKWEDPICANGGKWTMNFSRGELLALIGEQFDHGDEICGAALYIRGKQERVSIWTKNASNEAAQVSIGRQWKEFLDYNSSIGFIIHEDAKKLNRNAKSAYTT
ncbi:hypothetical protein N665_5502s0002 [Sinapis alba]|nr:hypothetical protein N665_5502s0002 [Sinapis alba]